MKKFKILPICIVFCLAVTLVAACDQTTPTLSSSSSSLTASSSENFSSAFSNTDFSQSSATQSSAIESSATQSSVTQSSAAQSSATQSSVTQSSAIQSSAAQSSSAAPLNPTSPIAANYLNGTLYGDDDFKEKCLQSSEREIKTPADIPSDAIFVSTSGSNSDSGTQEKPLKTLQSALSKATALAKANKPAVIIMRGGVYEPTYFYSLAQGTKDNYIVITNYPDEEVKISPKDGGTETTGLFHFGTSSYFIVEGLKFCDNIGTTVAKAVTVDGNGGSNHIIFKNNEIYNIKVTASKANAPLCSFRGTNVSKSLNNVLIYNNNIHDCVCGWSEAITVVGNCEYFNVIANTVKNTGNIGIDIAGNWGDVSGENDQARFVVVRGNDVSECNSPNARSYALYVDGARDCIFENNYAYSSQGGIEIGSENIYPDHPVKNIIVRNNVVFNNSEQGITIGGYNPTKAYYCYNITVENNTVVNNGEEGSGQIKISMVDGVSITNNIFYHSQNFALTGGGLAEAYSTNVVFKNNLYYGGAIEAEARFTLYNVDYVGFESFKQKCGETGFYADPQFKNLAENDFTLLPSSPAINSGLDVETTFYDILFNNRKNQAIDIGAYEY